TSAGRNARANRLPAGPASGVSERLALITIAVRPTMTATAASTSQKVSQVWLLAAALALFSANGPDSPAVTSAVTPISTPPQPGTAVKLDARAIVSRINRRFSAA